MNVDSSSKDENQSNSPSSTAFSPLTKRPRTKHTLSTDEGMININPAVDPQVADFINEDPFALATSNINDTNFVRRSSRDPQLGLLVSPRVQECLQRIRENHDETIVFKLKDTVKSDLNSKVLDGILDALEENHVCQALYIQNCNESMNDEQFYHVIKLLKQKRIWAMNIGENYLISHKAWLDFCDALGDTILSHCYISEHVISVELKTRVRDLIRINRAKHDRHSNMNNISVIEKCTNLWWNPINTIKHRIQAKFAKAAAATGASEAVTPKKYQKKGTVTAKAST